MIKLVVEGNSACLLIVLLVRVELPFRGLEVGVAVSKNLLERHP